MYGHVTVSFNQSLENFKFGLAHTAVTTAVKIGKFR